MIPDPNAPAPTMFDSFLASFVPALTNAGNTVIDAYAQSTAASINPSPNQVDFAALLGQGGAQNKKGFDPTILILLGGLFLVLHRA